MGLCLLLMQSGIPYHPVVLQADTAATEGTVERYAWLLLAAVIIGMVAQRLNVPYAIALVVSGLIVEETHVAPVSDLEPNLLLFVFLPPLLFDAAFRLDARELRSLAPAVLYLAVPGVFVTAIVIGAALWGVVGLPLATALLFGAIVAATDPVAVIGVFGHLRVSHRLSVTAEAESLVNDGMAITLYVVLMDWAVGGVFDVGGSVRVFGQEVVGGVLIGAVLGFAAVALTRFVDDHLIEMTLSAALAYGSYLTADSVHASGPLACVAAGLIHGSFGRRIGMSKDTRNRLDDLWEFLGFIANALVFLLLGFSVHLGDLRDHLWPVLAAIVAVLLARALVTGSADVLARPRGVVRNWREALLLTWGGLRGALTAALALALPPETPHREVITAMAFGVALFSLVVQGMTLPTVIRRLGLAASSPGGGEASSSSQSAG